MKPRYVKFCVGHWSSAPSRSKRPYAHVLRPKEVRMDTRRVDISYDKAEA
jgi:hypothetical protein